MNSETENLRPYRLFGMTLLQFMGMLGAVGIGLFLIFHFV